MLFLVCLENLANKSDFFCIYWPAYLDWKQYLLLRDQDEIENNNHQIISQNLDQKMRKLPVYHCDFFAPYFVL